MRALPLTFLVLCGFSLTGCLERTIRVTSEPSGAMVKLNDVEIGPTPVEAEFRFFGTYDVQLRKDGYEPITSRRKAEAPVHEWIGIDLVAAVIPVNFETKIEWHFELEPTIESSMRSDEFEAELLRRAEQMRGEVAGSEPREAD